MKGNTRVNRGDHCFLKNGVVAVGELINIFMSFIYNIA